MSIYFFFIYQTWQYHTSFRINIFMHYKSYTYSIIFTHKKLGNKIYYYGCRYTKILETRTPEEDCIYYYTGSSKELPDFLNSNEYIIEFKIRKKFLDKLDALKHETKFLHKIDAASKHNWINKTNGNGDFTNYRYVMSDKLREKNRNRMLGEKNHQFGKTGNLAPRYGKPHSENTKKLMSIKASGSNNAFFGKTHSAEIKSAISNRSRGNTYAKGRKLSKKEIETLRDNMLNRTNPMHLPEVIDKISNIRKSGMWITDGNSNRFISKELELPIGWRKGVTRKIKHLS